MTKQEFNNHKLTNKEYLEATRRTDSNKGKDILINGALGLAGECGEVVDIVKKHIYQGHNLDNLKIIDELGDVMWYVNRILDYIGTDLNEVLIHNKAKLEKRYPNGFEANRSIHRPTQEEREQFFEGLREY